MSFHNHQSVHSQVGHQIVQGNVHHHHHYHHDHADEIAVRKRHRVEDLDMQQQKHLDDLILESLAFPEMSERRRNIKHPDEDNCRWIFKLDEYQQWANDSSGLLWIKGKPGAGKSTLMSHLYSTTQIKLQATTRQHICLEYFFTARGVALERSSIGMFRSIANQIFHLDPSVRPLLRAPYRHKQASFGNVGWQWQQQELQLLCTDLVLASAQQRPVIIFVDALDEAGTQEAEELARYFYSLHDKADVRSANLQIAISCRHYPIPPARRAALEIHVENHNREAISYFIHDYINHYIDHDVSDSQTWQKLSETLSNMASGVFQWVCLVLPLVRKRVVSGVSPKRILRELPNISTELDQVYKYILERVIEDQVRALLLFQWVCLASRPLSITELRYAIATHDLAAGRVPSTCQETPDFIETDERMKICLRSWSGGLIEFSEGNSYLPSQVQPIHLSVKDFLVRRGFDILMQSVVNSTKADRQTANESRLSMTETIAWLHHQLYWSCLQYISSEEARFSARGHSLIDLSKRQFPLMEYVTSNIIYHAENTQHYPGRDLMKEEQLLAATIPAWTSMWGVCDYNSDSRLQCGTTPLHIAAAAGLDELAIYILDHDRNVSTTDKVGQTALHIAAKRGKLAIVQILLKAKADVHKTTVNYETPLTLAARYRQEDVFRCLLQHGASLSTSNSRSESALYTAAEANCIEIVKLCIDARTDVNALGGGYGNALQAASYLGSTELVKILLDAGADVNAQGGHYGNALQAASYRGSTELVKILLDAGTDVNAQGGGYGNALQAASYRGSTELVKILLNAGADVNAQGGHYGNALQAASSDGSMELVKILLDAGADVNAQGGHYGNALQAASYLGSTELVKILLDAGADVNAQGGNYGKALQAASSDGSTELVKILLDAGADVNAQGGGYGNALQAASYHGSMELVKILLDAGVDVNAQGGYYGNALQAASYLGSVELVKILLDAGADVNAQGGCYGNALQAASSDGSTELLKILLDAGADVNAQGGHYGNALQAASHLGSTELVKILLDAGADVNAQGGEYRSSLAAARVVLHSRRKDAVVRLLIEAGAAE